MTRKQILIILAVFVAPLAVFLASEGSPYQIRRTLISILFIPLAYAPSVIYALDIVLDLDLFYQKLDQL